MFQCRLVGSPALSMRCVKSKLGIFAVSCPIQKILHRAFGGINSYVEPNAPRFITTTTPLKASKFEAGDIIILKIYRLMSRVFEQYAINCKLTESYTIYLYNLHHLNGSTTESYTLINW